MEINNNETVKYLLIADLERVLDNYVQEWKLKTVELSIGLKTVPAVQEFPLKVSQEVTEPQFSAFMSKVSAIFKRYRLEDITEGQLKHLEVLLKPKINLDIEGINFSPVVGGTVTGAAAGAAIGSVVPVIGTLVGGFVGAMVGMGWTSNKSSDKFDSEKQIKIPKSIDLAELEIKSKRLEVINVLTGIKTE